jgi:hypothetical protein
MGHYTLGAKFEFDSLKGHKMQSRFEGRPLSG